MGNNIRPPISHPGICKIGLGRASTRYEVPLMDVVGVPREVQQEVKSSSSPLKEPSQSSYCLEQKSSSPTLRPERKRKLSPPSSDPDRLPKLNDLNAFDIQDPTDYRRCPSCKRVCWWCQSSTFKAPPKEQEIRSMPKSELETLPSVPLSAVTFTTSIGESTRSKKRRMKEQGTKCIGPRDPDFFANVLEPCLLVVDDKRTMNLLPKDVFPAQLLHPESKLYLKKLDHEIKIISGEFLEFEARDYDESALRTICQSTIVLRDPFVDKSVPFGNDKFAGSVRRDKWTLRTKGPPIPPNAKFAYDWALEPDTTYAVSINMFDGIYRATLVQNKWQCWLAEEYAVCPYLTIEYKCSATTGKRGHARNQNTTASLIWLYQRKQMRDLLQKSLDELRHYSIVICDSEYTISEAYIGKDNRYHIRVLTFGHLKNINGLKTYIEWSNALHTWGLGANAMSFKEDMEMLVERIPKVPDFPPPDNTPVGPAPTS